MKKTIFGLGTLALLALAWALDTQGIFPWFIAAALIHEGGHVAAVYLSGGSVRGFRPCAAGFELSFDCRLSYLVDAFVAACGPAANLIAAFFASVAAKYGYYPEQSRLFAGMNILICAFNMLPAMPMDGGRILFSLAARCLSYDAAWKISRIATLVVGLFLTAAGVYIAAKTRYNITMLFAGVIIIGGLYAKGDRKNTFPGAKTRPLFRRRVRAGDKTCR